MSTRNTLRDSKESDMGKSNLEYFDDQQFENEESAEMDLDLLDFPDDDIVPPSNRPLLGQRVTPEDEIGALITTCHLLG